MDHITTIEDLTLCIKCDGISEDYIFFKLFTYSLVGEAVYWFRKLPPGSLTAWWDIKNAFLNNFFNGAATRERKTDDVPEHVFEGQ